MLKLKAAWNQLEAQSLTGCSAPQQPYFHDSVTCVQIQVTQVWAQQCQGHSRACDTPPCWIWWHVVELKVEGRALGLKVDLLPLRVVGLKNAPCQGSGVAHQLPPYEVDQSQLWTAITRLLCAQLELHGIHGRKKKDRLQPWSKATVLEQNCCR